MVRENNRQPNVRQNPETEQSESWKLTRMIRKLNKVNPVSHMAAFGESTADFLIQDAKKTFTIKPGRADRFVGAAAIAPVIGLGALLVGAVKLIRKTPEWLDKGLKSLEKSIPGFGDFNPIDSQVTSSFLSAKQMAHTHWGFKQAKA